MKELKEKYQNDFKQIRKAMNKFDPCGFMEMKCPFDEYDYLTNKVLSLKYNKESNDKIKEVILFDLTKYYGYGVETIKDNYLANFFNDLDNFLNNIQNIG